MGNFYQYKRQRSHGILLLSATKHQVEVKSVAVMGRELVQEHIKASVATREALRPIWVGIYS